MIIEPFGECLNLNGDPIEIIKELHEYFISEIVQKKIYFKNKEVIINGSQRGFEHLYANDYWDKCGQRLPDYKRAKRIHWIKYMIENCDDSRFTYFEEKTQDVLKYYIWFRQGKYVVILQNINALKVVLVSAFYVESWKVGKFEKKLHNYENEIAANGGDQTPSTLGR